MLRIARALFVAACLLAAAAPLSHAGPPTMSYQGVLTDNLGNLVPDGNYNLTFRIYDDPVAGNLHWTEAHAGVPVVKGGFSVVLGSTVPVNVPFEYFLTYYLGVQVGADPELTPRVALSGSPSAMSLGMLGDNGNLAGFMSWLPSTSGLGAGGGYLYLYGLTNGTSSLVLEPDFSGVGLWATLVGYGGSHVNWNGDTGGAEGTFTISGLSSTLFNTAQAGDGAVQLPSDAVSAVEVLDEPGIASNHAINATSITSTSGGALTDVLATTITTPAAGYIVVEADAQVLAWAGQEIGVQLHETPGAPVDDAYYFFVGSTSTTAFTYWPTSIRRVYYKATAGSYTFYFQAYRFSAGGGGTPYAWNPTITAQYFPTAYGGVTVAATAAEASGFERVTPVAATAGAVQPGGAGVLVDLRELELRVRREEARLAEARVQLQAARMKEQQEASARAASRSGRAVVAPAPKEER